MRHLENLFNVIFQVFSASGSQPSITPHKPNCLFFVYALGSPIHRLGTVRPLLSLSDALAKSCTPISSVLAPFPLLPSFSLFNQRLYHLSFMFLWLGCRNNFSNYTLCVLRYFAFRLMFCLMLLKCLFFSFPP